MKQLKYSTINRKGKHLTYEERLKIEVLYKAKMKAEKIGQIIGQRSRRTIEREIQRGLVEQLDTNLIEYKIYSADIGQQKHDKLASNKGTSLKIGHDFALVEFIEEKIGKERLSPYAALMQIKVENKKFQTNLCVKTIYNYLDMYLFLNISNKDLWIKKKGKKRRYRHIRQAYNNVKGRSISERPPDIDKREKIGHWEMDTVVGKPKSKTTLLVLSERKTRYEIIYKMKGKTQKEVIKALNKLERKLGTREFRKTFKSITCDNGCEFLDMEGIEQSMKNKRKRTKVYYAHPYSAWERGTNENINKMIRRFIPKGKDIGEYSEKEIKRIEHYINNCPRKILAGAPARITYNKLMTA